MSAANDSDGIARFGAEARLILAVLFVACVILYWPALNAGFLADDLFQISMFYGVFGEHSPFGLYFFALPNAESTAEHMARGSLPWWTVPHFRFAMLRPLSSLLIAFDHAAMPDRPFGHHLHTLLWFALAIAATITMLRRVTTTRIILVAVAIFALDETMAWIMAWLANRCALVAMAFAMLAVAIHIRWRTRVGSRRKLIAAETCAWALAFAGGEYAACGVAYLVAYELVAASGRWRHRFAALIPSVVVMMIFATVFLVLGCGVYGATTYIDPFGEPVQFIKSASERVPRMAGEVWLGFLGESDRFWIRYAGTGLSDFVMPNDGADLFVQAWRHARFALVMIAVTTIPTWLVVRRYLEPHERRTVKWMALGSVLGLIPVAAIPPATRSLLLPNLGASVFFASVLVAMGRAWRQRATGPVRLALRVGVTAAGLWWASLQLGMESMFIRQQLEALGGARLAYGRFYGNPAFKELDLRKKHVVVIATPGLVTGIHGLSMMNVLNRPMPKSWHVLAMGRRPYILRRLGPRKIEMLSVGGPMHIGPQEALFRSPLEALRVGDVVDAELFKAKIIHERKGEGPDGVHFTFRRQLDHRSIVFLEVGEDGLRPFELPPRGSTVAVKPPLLPSVMPRG